VLHDAIAQAPLTQLLLALLSWQAVVQLPQWLSSVLSATSQPSEAVVFQFA
jgi:hypothetical protein